MAPQHASPTRLPRISAVAIACIASALIGFGIGYPAGYAMHAASSRPAVGASHAPDTRHVVTRARPVRPIWDGRGSWPANGIQPLCPAADAGHLATVGHGSIAFVVRCSLGAWQSVASVHAWHLDHRRHLVHLDHVRSLE